jgi:hypothetical protein
LDPPVEDDAEPDDEDDYDEGEQDPRHDHSTLVAGHTDRPEAHH